MQTDKNSRQNTGDQTKFFQGTTGIPDWPAAEETRHAWKKLYDRLRDEQLVPPQRTALKTTKMHYLLRMAAIALILMGATGVVFFMTARWPLGEKVNIETGSQATTLIKILNDGSVIYLAQNSLFSFPEKFESELREVELKGEAFFDIAPNPGHPFVVETDEALIRVLGTAFHVKSQKNNGIELYVDRGSVKITLKKDPSHSEYVTAGEMVSTTMDRIIKTKYHARDTMAWYKKNMHFKDETLQNIIYVLNRNFNTTFATANNETGQHRLTVTFHDESAETMAGLICAALNLKSQYINGFVVLSDKKEGEKQQ